MTPRMAPTRSLKRPQEAGITWAKCIRRLATRYRSDGPVNELQHVKHRGGNNKRVAVVQAQAAIHRISELRNRQPLFNQKRLHCASVGAECQLMEWRMGNSNALFSPRGPRSNGLEHPLMRSLASGSAHFAKRSDADTKRIRCSLGLGTSAASRCMNSSGHITKCVVPSRQGVSSLSTTCPAALVCTRSSVLGRARAAAAQLLRRLAVVGSAVHGGVLLCCRRCRRRAIA